jgi:hypothetical protein
LKLSLPYCIILALTAVLTACGPASKLRRAEKLIQKAELQGAKWKIDTVWVERQVFVPEIGVDTLIISKPGDTVVISKDRLQVKYVRLRGDTVFVDAKCLPDTVKVTVPVTVTKEIVVHGRLRWYHLVGWSLLALIFGVIAGRLLKIVI